MYSNILAYAFAWTVLARDKTFGNDPECNSEAVIVFFFARFQALHSGRTIGIVLLAIFGPLILFGYVRQIQISQTLMHASRRVRRQFEALLQSKILGIFVIWGMLVAHTELLIRWSHFQSGPNDWGFGQIFPMFLILLPLLDFLGPEDKVPDIFTLFGMDTGGNAEDMAAFTTYAAAQLDGA